MDYVINFYKKGKYLFSIGADNADYENVIWWQLHNIINYENLNNITKSDVEDLRDKFGYWYLLDDEKPLDDATNIDVEDKKIHLAHTLYFYDTDEEIDDIVLVEKDGKLYADHDEDELREIANFTIEDFNLLQKLDVSFNELEEINNLVNKCLDTNLTDFIINETHFISFDII